MGDLAGSVALVVDGGRGVGAAVALALADAGAAVALLAREACELTAVAAMLRIQHHAVLGVTADYSDPDAVALALDDARAALGPITLVVDPVGLPAAWDAALPDMLDAGHGTIILIAAAANRASALANYPATIACITVAASATPAATAAHVLATLAISLHH
jgi:7-alpha-hydroxysteroid dehydrogenase